MVVHLFLNNNKALDFLPINSIKNGGITSAAYNKRLDNNQVLYTVTNTQTLTADFAAKTLTGSIRTSGNQTDEHFPIQARIEGNRFESAADAAQKTKGAFFGKNATEIGGVFQDVNTIGAFVGKQQ